MRKNKVHNVSAKEARDTAKTVPDGENDAAAAAVIQGLFMISAVCLRNPFTKRAIQGGPLGRGTLFVDIKLQVPPQYFLLKLKRNCFFNALLDQMDHPED